MKKIIISISTCLLIASGLQAQISKTGSVTDPNYQGVKVFSSTGYSGSATTCNIVGRTYTFPKGIKSVKVYGAYKLVNINNSLSLTQDDPYYSSSGGGTWKLVRTTDRYYGIAYSESNYSGEATYLKLGRKTDFFKPVKSLKLGVAAKIGYSNSTGYQECITGYHKTLGSPVSRVDINWSYTECAPRPRFPLF